MQNNNLVDIKVGSEEEMELIYNKLGEFNGQQVPFTQALNAKNEPVFFNNYVIKENGAVIAGIKSFIYGWGIVFIELLFVEKSHRHQKMGTLLLNKVESEAKAFGASLIHLDTFDFQAKDFYLKHNYEVYGALDDCPPGHKRYHLKKVLS